MASYRLNKVAREFNVAIKTLVEYLEEKGYQVNVAPNTKISEAQYELLTTVFQCDKKEEASSLQEKNGRPQRTNAKSEKAKDCITDDAIYRRYGKVIQGCKRLCKICFTKKENKDINALLLEKGIDADTVNRMVVGKLESDSPYKPYVSVICHYLHFVAEKKEICKEKWDEHQMPFDYAIRIIENGEGTLPDYNLLLNLLQQYGRIVGEIKVVDPILIEKSPGMWDVPKISKIHSRKYVSDKDLYGRLRRSKKTHGRYSQHTRKEFGYPSNPLLIKRK